MSKEDEFEFDIDFDSAPSIIVEGDSANISDDRDQTVVGDDDDNVLVGGDGSDVIEGGKDNGKVTINKISEYTYNIKIEGGDVLWGGPQDASEDLAPFLELETILNVEINEDPSKNKSRNVLNDREPDTFIYFPGDGVDIIKDFEVGIDIFELHGYDLKEAKFYHSGQDTFIQLDEGGVLFENVYINERNAFDFIKIEATASGPESVEQNLGTSLLFLEPIKRIEPIKRLEILNDFSSTASLPPSTSGLPINFIPPPAPPGTKINCLMPNTLFDQADLSDSLIGAMPTSGNFSLREAILQANSGDADGDGLLHDTICLQPGVYNLDINGLDDLGWLGDLDVLQDLTIEGKGKQGGSLGGTTIKINTTSDRVLDVIGAHLKLTDVEITGGYTSDDRFGLSGYGGGILNQMGKLELDNVNINGNAAYFSGGGIYSIGGTVIITESIIGKNKTAGYGGGITNEGSNLTIDNSTLSENVASSYGGGIFNDGTLHIIQSALIGNEAFGYGGAIFDNGVGTRTIVASTLSGNTAMSGGAIELYSGIFSSPVTIVNSTIVNNTSTDYMLASAIDDANWGVGSGIAITSTIVAANFTPNILGNLNQDIAWFIILSSGGYNLLGNIDGVVVGGAGNIISSTFTTLGSIGLGGLMANGGGTSTHALLIGSPAIDSGRPYVLLDPLDLPVDQRGAPIIDFTTGLADLTQKDIGAFERQIIEPIPPVVLDLNNNGLDLVPLLTSSIYLDTNHDGTLEKIAWIGPEDGILVYDGNHNLQVDGIEEWALAAYHPEAKTDLEGLRLAFDTNDDLIFDKFDEEFLHFGVWQDKNQNAKFDDGEFSSLTDAGVKDIHLGPVETINETDTNYKTIIFGTTPYTLTDGSIHLAYDVALGVEEVAPNDLLNEMVYLGAQEGGAVDSSPELNEYSYQGNILIPEDPLNDIIQFQSNPVI